MLEKIIEGIYAHTQGKTIGNIGVISAASGNFLIDTSMYPIVARELRQELDKLGTGKVRATIFTHYHADHTWGAQHFADAPIYGHYHTDENMKNALQDQWSPESVQKALSMNQDSANMFEGLEITRPSKIFHDKKIVLDEDSSIEIYHVGGHTSGSSIIFYRPENVIFAGDNLFAGMFPWGGDPSASPFEWLSSLETIKELSPKIIVPGHGPVQFNLKEVEYLADYIRKVIEKSKQMAKEHVGVDRAVEELLELDFHPARSEDMKKMTLKRWYEVINH